jgi:hypothetical protein
MFARVTSNNSVSFFLLRWCLPCHAHGHHRLRQHAHSAHALQSSQFDVQPSFLRHLRAKPTLSRMCCLTRMCSPKVQSYTSAQIRACRFKYAHVGSNTRMWVQIRACGFKYAHVGSNTRMWVQIRACGFKYAHVGSNMRMRVQIRACEFKYAHVDSNTVGSNTHT